MARPTGPDPPPQLEAWGSLLLPLPLPTTPACRAGAPPPTALALLCSCAPRRPPHSLPASTRRSTGLSIRQACTATSGDPSSPDHAAASHFPRLQRAPVSSRPCAPFPEGRRVPPAHPGPAHPHWPRPPARPPPRHTPVLPRPILHAPGGQPLPLHVQLAQLRT